MYYMKKRICLCCLGILFVLLIFVFLIQNKKSENIILKSQKEQNVVSSNAISMMYETEVGSGEYQTSTDTTWPSPVIFLMKDYLNAKMVEHFLGMKKQKE